MKLTVILLAGVCVAFAACNKDTPSSQVIPSAQMEQILLDMHLAEGIAERKGGSLERRKAVRDDIMVQILQQQGISREAFLESYQYYLDHPDLLDSIYAHLDKKTVAMLDTLQRLNYGTGATMDTSKRPPVIQAPASKDKP